jgi:hypothetical protein
MRGVLQLWAREAGVELVWDSAVEFPVKQTLNMQGDFESALEAMLEQYQGDTIRPIGRLHAPPGEGAKFLVIEAARV